MLASTILTKVRRQLVEASAAFWSDAEILDLINDGERDFNNDVRLLQGKYQTNILEGEAQYPLPTNWLAKKAIFVNNPGTNNTPNWRRLGGTDLEKQAQENPNFLSDDPRTYGDPIRGWIWNHTLILTPTPKTTVPGGLVMFYEAKPVPLSNLNQQLSIDDTFEDTIISYVLWKAWSKEKQSDLAKTEEAKFYRGVQSGRRWMKKREGDKRSRLDIDSAVPFSSNGNLSTGFNPF